MGAVVPFKRTEPARLPRRIVIIKDKAEKPRISLQGMQTLKIPYWKPRC